MPRRNLFLLLVVGIVALVCYKKVQTNQYGQILSESLTLINRFSLEKVDSEKLFEGAMDGMVDQLDEYSAYIPPKGFNRVPREHRSTVRRRGHGGIDRSKDAADDRSQSAVGSPAYEAGVRAGDKILRIDEHSTQGMSIKDAVSLMRGKPGDPVGLTVLHSGEDKPVDIHIVRAIINIDTVLGDTRNDDGSWNYFLPGDGRIGYLRITSFGEKTVDDLKRAVQWLTEHDMRGLILDLRDDPGGLLYVRNRHLRHVYHLRHDRFHQRPRWKHFGRLASFRKRTVYKISHGSACEPIQR